MLFSAFHVLPSYGPRETVVEWERAQGSTGNVYIARSETGVNGSWVVLNNGAPMTGLSGQITDTHQALDVFSIFYYRGVVDPGDGSAPATWPKGPSVTAFDTLARHEYFIVREILRREYLSMRGPAGQGIPAFHLVARQSGPQAANTDIETGQRLGPTCRDDPDAGYGKIWKGGYFPPVQTWVRMLQMDGEDPKYRNDAKGADPDGAVKFRFLAFPKVDEGHVIILPESDRRYTVLPPVERFFFRGIAPIAWEAKCAIIDRDDDRHKIPVPELQRDFNPG